MKAWERKRRRGRWCKGTYINTEDERRWRKNRRACGEVERGGGRVTRPQLGETTFSADQQRWDYPEVYREIVTYRCTCFRARMHTNTLGMVTETYINNVAERNRMQFLPYIRVYRRLARSEQPLPFSALPSGWMHTRFLELINHHICLPNNFNR